MQNTIDINTNKILMFAKNLIELSILQVFFFKCTFLFLAIKTR